MTSTHPSRSATRPIRRSQQLIAVFMLMAFFANDANAYIDPNTGGLLYQILLPLIVAVTAGWRHLRLVVTRLLHRLTGRSGEPQVDDVTATGNSKFES